MKLLLKSNCSNSPSSLPGCPGNPLQTFKGIMCQVPSLLGLAPWPIACFIWFVAPLAPYIVWYHVCMCVYVCVCVGLLDLPWLKIATNKNHANLKPRKWLGKRQTMLPAIWPKCFYSITHVNYASFTQMKLQDCLERANTFEVDKSHAHSSFSSALFFLL